MVGLIKTIGTFCIFAVILHRNEVSSAGPGLQMPEEKSIFEDSVEVEEKANKPRYEMDHEYRLPRGLIPEHYIVHIRPILHKDDSNGDVEDTAPGQIQNKANDKIHDIFAYSEDLRNQIVELKLESTQELKAGEKYTIYVKFISKIHESQLGMYHQKYMTPSGEKKLVSTYLEAIGARMVFPCFDEPALKATYQINIAHTDEYYTLCNMEISKSVQDPILINWTWDEYHPTVKMSTYLIGIVVSDFTKKDASPGIYEKPVSTWGPQHHIQNGGALFGADFTARVLKYYEELHDLKYPLPKMDSSAIPKFHGGMENWGLITYSYEYLLYFPGVSTEADRIKISRLIAHEVAHQWFGNIVTMDWWSHLWLNERFARYMETVGVDKTYPEFGENVFTVYRNRIWSMVADAKASTKPVRYNGHLLDQIVYNKASFLIRMMESFLTKATFQKGVNTYLKAHLYGTAEQDDLFVELTRAAHEDKTLNKAITVKSIMDTWTRQTGFPLVRVGRVTKEKVFVSQERFGIIPPIIDTLTLNPYELWTVPLSFATTQNADFTPKNQKPNAWLDKSSTLDTFSLTTGEADWVILNVDATAYFRVIYDTHLTKNLKAQLDTDSKIISPATRSQIIDDHFKCAFERYIPVSMAMDFTTFLDQEETLVVWQTFFTNFRTSFILLNGHSKHSIGFKKYIFGKLAGGLNLVGVKQLPHHNGFNVLFRVQRLDWACSLGLDVCTGYAKELFQTWTNNPTFRVPVDIRPVMYCAMVWSGGKPAMDFFLKLYKDEPDNKLWPYIVKPLFRNALACASKNEDIDELLAYTLQEGSGLSQADGLEILKWLGGSFEGRPKISNFLQKNLKQIIARYEVQGVRDIIFAQVVHWSEVDKIDELNSFINTYESDLDGVLPAIKEFVQFIGNNFKWMNNFGNEMGAWFDTYKPADYSTSAQCSSGRRSIPSTSLGLIIVTISIKLLN